MWFTIGIFEPNYLLNGEILKNYTVRTVLLDGLTALNK